MILTAGSRLFALRSVAVKRIPVRSIRKLSTFPEIDELHRVKKHFTNDLNLYDKLDLIESFTKGNTDIRIGIIAKDRKNKKFVETFLVDPFDVKDWYEDLKQRDFTKNNLIRIGKSSELGLQSDIDVYEIPSSEIKDNIAIKSFEILEINNCVNKDNTRIEGADTITSHIGEDIATSAGGFGCHLYIHVKSSSFEDLPNDDRFINWPFISVINSRGHSQSELIVDLDAASKANDLLIGSTSNSSEYTSLMVQSHLFEVIEAINKKTDPGLVVAALTKSVVEQLYVQLSGEKKQGKISAVDYYKLQTKRLDTLEKEVKAQVLDWEQNSHAELQQSVKVYCDKITNPTFSDIVKILFKVDDLNVIYENLILTNGFPSNSDKHFNYIVGKFRKGDTEVPNHFDKLKESLAADQLPRLQSAIHNQILWNFWAIQLPTFTVCTVFHIFYEFEVNTLAAILALGLAISLNNISKNVLKEFKNFNQWYLESNRVSISQNSESLKALSTKLIEADRALLDDKFEVIKSLEKRL